MKILIVEDDVDFISALAQIISKYTIKPDIVIAESQELAFELIDAQVFDLIILDLNIPTKKGALDGNPVYGYAVFTTARLGAPGTPVIVLTGSSAEEFIDSMMSLSGNTDIWGSGTPIPIVVLHKKHKLDAFPAVLSKYLTNIQALKGIELQKGELELNEEEERLIRIFGRSVHGVRCVVNKIGGGLSGSSVFKLTVTDATGSIVHDAISKIGNIERLKDEDHRYARHITRLPPEATPRKLSFLEYGAKKNAGLFYGLAYACSRNAFSEDVVLGKASNVLQRLEDLLKRWDVTVQSRKTVADIRRHFLDDDRYVLIQEKYDLDFISYIEADFVQVKWGSTHGDLHGLNVLVSDDNIPVLIDYGDCSEGPLSLDPITLELSLFFHPEGPLNESTWPTEQQSYEWGNLELYLQGCPFPDFIRSCRAWAYRCAAGQREIAVVAYSYLLKQLKYQDVDPKKIISLLKGVNALYGKT